MKKKNAFLIYILFFSGVLISFLAGFFTNTFIRTRFESFPVLLEAHQLLLNNAYYEIPEEPMLEYGMIRGMLDAYGDEYTRFLEPVQHELEDDELSGEYGGIGVRFGTDSDGNVIMYPFPEGPAARAGVRDGDVLISIDDLRIDEQTSIESIAAAMRGPEGTHVNVSVRQQDDQQIREYRIQRENFPLPSVTSHVDVTYPQLGVVEINLIAATTTQETQTAIDNLLSQGIDYLLVDLRNNRGGLVDTGINFASMFLEEGNILEQTYRNKPTTTYSVKNGQKYLDIPLVILVNGNTASSAEIIAGILQANDRAVLFGSNSIGKTSIQYVYTLSDESSIHITASKWNIPQLDYDLAVQGLIPDVEIKDDSSEDEIIDAVFDYFSRR